MKVFYLATYGKYLTWPLIESILPDHLVKVYYLATY